MSGSDLAERIARDFVRSAGEFNASPYDPHAVDALTELIESLNPSDGMLVWSALACPAPPVVEAVIDLVAARLRRLGMTDQPARD